MRPHRDRTMNPDRRIRGLVGRASARIESVLERAACRRRGGAAALHEAMRYAVLGGGKRVRALLAYAAGELAGADPDAVDAAGRRGRADPRLLARPRRPAVHGRRRAAARQADLPRRVRRGDRAARRRRAAEPRLRGAGRRDARCGGQRRAAGARSRRARAWRAGRRSISQARARRSTLPELEAMHATQDRRADPRRGAPRRGLRPPARRRRERRTRPLRRRPSDSPSRSSTTSSTSKAPRRAWARPRARTRCSASRPTCRCWASPPRRSASTRCAPMRARRSRGFGSPARRLLETRRLDRAADALMVSRIRCEHDQRARRPAPARRRPSCRSSRASCARSS